MICVDWHLGQFIESSVVIEASGLSAYHYYASLPQFEREDDREIPKQLLNG
jgi:hypothetical protein